MYVFFFSSRRRHTRCSRDWSSDVCSSDLDDGDWHIELTEGAASPVDSCVVVEIPASRYSPRYALAREAFDSLLGGRKIRKGGALDQPVLVRVAGAAFFDGQHRRGGRRSDETDGGHGRCNSSVRALWEIHPVYRMIPP